MQSNHTTPSAHTPGPWHVEPTPTAQFLIQLDDWSTIARVGEGPHEGGSREALQANARLIALSPEMLDGLIDIRNKTESLDYEDGDDEGRMNEQERALD